MQKKLEVKKQDVEIQGGAALVKSMQSQIKKLEDKKERERQEILAEKAALRAAKKPKKEVIEPIDWMKLCQYLQNLNRLIYFYFKFL